MAGGQHVGGKGCASGGKGKLLTALSGNELIRNPKLGFLCPYSAFGCMARPLLHSAMKFLAHGDPKDILSQGIGAA